MLQFYVNFVNYYWAQFYRKLTDINFYRKRMIPFVDFSDNNFFNSYFLSKLKDNSFSIIDFAIMNPIICYYVRFKSALWASEFLQTKCISSHFIFFSSFKQPST